MICVNKSLFFLVIFICIALDCNGAKVRSFVDNNSVVGKFEKDAHYIFSSKHIDIKYFSSYNADRIIFQIKRTDDDDQDFLRKIENPLAEKGWSYKGKYKQAYVYCNSKLNQLELVPPFSNNNYSSIGEGQTLNQLVDYWNVSFISSKHKRYMCSKVN
ncbi:hypothetical protein D7V20_04945 [Acinetobacter rongchengensis]|uniref:Uncharacterized protein n=1 Tax=Acinetobacter rongchengensis TaxID=2419601 RepID=A0A3A8F8Y9_9GAMM|nr:hypothetical protein D7V20_04945 [Acinetobacter rongchengensis]